MDDGAQSEPDWATDRDEAVQPAADFDVDRQARWGEVETSSLMGRRVGLRDPPQMILPSGAFCYIGPPRITLQRESRGFSRGLIPTLPGDTLPEVVERPIRWRSHTEV